jgi:hypothetical protein
MTKEEMVLILRNGGTNETTITAMEFAFDQGVAYERERLQPKKIKATADDYCQGDERYYANE